MLNVTANTLRVWERRFGYPRPQRSRGNHRQYTYAEIVALREALQDGLSISSAVSVAREALSSDVDALLRALGALDAERADRAMEASLGLRSVERSVEDVLLPSLREIHRRDGGDSVRAAFAAVWVCDWLRRARRLASPPQRGLAVLVGDASGGDLEPTTPYVRAFELFCIRGGAHVVTLPVTHPAGIAEAVHTIEPDAIVIAGGSADDETLARWAYRARTAAGSVPLALFHRDVHGVGPNARARMLDPSPVAAEEQLAELLDTERRRARTTPLRELPGTGPPRHSRTGKAAG